MTTLDEVFDERIAEAINKALGPYLERLADPEPLVYTQRDCAKVLRTSTDKVRQLIADEVLPTVPHMGGRVLIPRAAVQALVESGMFPLRRAS